MNCPRCATEQLSSLPSPNGPTLDFCVDCGGTFYDEGEFKTVHEVLGPLPPLLREGSDQRPGPSCPRCAAIMIELDYPPTDGVRVDVCPQCQGLWLDGGEAEQLYEKVAAAPAAPERARPAYTEVKSRSGRTLHVPVQLKDETGLQWRWVVGGAVIMLMAQAALVGFWEFSLAWDALGDAEGGPSRTMVLGVGALLGYAVGGFVVGRSSSGHTIYEPAVAAVPASIAFALIFQAHFPLLLLVGLMVLGVVLSVAAAALGERRQAA